MFYKILSASLVLLGALHVGHAFFYGNGVNESVMWEVSEGVTTILIGILNYIYLYESQNTQIPKAILLVSNALFIGYLILMVTHHMNVIPSYISLVLVLTCSMLVLNKKV
jgi:CHASE2 domain-containing sensor protein